MNWQDIINDIEKYKAKQTYDNWVDLNLFSDKLGIVCGYPLDDVFNTRVKKIWISSWICTDTKVGLAAYTFDDEVIAVSSQHGRKWDEVIEFVSENAALKLRKFLIEFCIQNIPNIAELDKELDKDWFLNKDWE